MEILTSLGVDGRILLAQVVNFLILLWVLNRFVYRPLLAVLDRRSKAIEQGIKDAEEAKRQLDTAREEAGKIDTGARAEARALIAEAEAASKREREAAVTETKMKIEAMLAAGEKQLAEERAKMLAEVRAELASLVVLATGKILRKNVNSTENERLATEALSEIAR